MKQIRASRRLLRGNPLLRERLHDPYRAGEKLRERTGCPECGAQYRNGRWTWPHSGSASAALKPQLCPACRRVADDYPAGEVVLTGRFWQDHRSEILAAIRHVEAAESQEHPLNRILAVDEDEGALLISTTDLHLPHRIGHALRDAWGGSLSTHYDAEGCFTRVRWERDV